MDKARPAVRRKNNVTSIFISFTNILMDRESLESFAAIETNDFLMEKSQVWTKRRIRRAITAYVAPNSLIFNDKRRVIIGENEWLMQALGLPCHLSISVSEDL